MQGRKDMVAAAGSDATMRALFFPEAHRLESRRVPVPDPRPGEARVRIHLCGICGSDLSVFASGALAGPDVVLGHEVVATVDRDTTGTHAFGDRVVVYPPRGCGECDWCRAGEPRHCEEPLERWGAFAEYAVYPARHLIPVPAAVGDAAATLADPLGVAIRAVDIAVAEEGMVAYVNGLGPIGLCTTAVLAAAGCRVIGGDVRPDRRAAGEGMGAIEVIDPIREDPYEIGKAMDPFGPQLAFECSGSEAGLQQIFDSCAPGGTVGILGIPKLPVLLLRMTVREQRAFSIAGPTLASMEAALAHLEVQPEMAEMITGIVPLDAAGGAMESLLAGDGGIKVLVDARA